MSEQAPVVEEVIARLVVAGQMRYEWRCTPHDLEALGVGRLFIDGFTANGFLEVVRVGEEYEIRTDGVSQIARGQAHRDTGNIPSAEEFAELFRALFAGVDERHESGGMHAAALARAGTIAFQAEDVGRHNAVDKVIGLAVLADTHVADHGILVSARISGEIARKAVRSGVAWLASRSIPTTLAVQIAHEANMPIIGRAAGKGAHIYR